MLASWLSRILIMKCISVNLIGISLLLVSASSEGTDDGQTIWQNSLVEFQKELLTLKATIAIQNARIADQNVRIADQSTQILQLENALRQMISDQNEEIQRLRYKTLETDVQTKSNLADQNLEIQKQHLKYCQLENKINNVVAKCPAGFGVNNTKHQNVDEYISKSDISDLQEEIEATTLRLQMLNASHVRAQEKLIRLENKCRDSSHIAFLARVSTATTIQGDTVITFDELVVNEGNAYSEYTGIFTAPSAGLYLFSWTLITHSDEEIHSDLYRNGVRVAKQYASRSHYDMATTIAIIILTEGDKLYVKHDPEYEADGTDILNQGYNTFLGYRIK